MGLLLPLLRRAGDALLRIPRPPAAGLALLWMGLIWTLSDGPQPEVPRGLPWSLLSNLAHAPLFGMLGLLLTLALPRPAAGRGWPLLSPRNVVLVLFFVVAYGVFDEWHQSAVPERSATLRDVVTDLTGAACMLWTIAYLASPAATEGGVRGRLLAGFFLCLAAAGIACA